MIFYKTSSFGNDFIEIELKELLSAAGDAKAALARAICDRQRGVGADGVVFYRIKKAGYHFEIFNRDGGRAELSGNGMAGLAAVLFKRRLASSPLTLHGVVGKRRIELLDREGPLFRLNVEIGIPDFDDRGFFPFLDDTHGPCRCSGAEFHPVSIGNPHAVVVCREMPPEARLREMGEMLEGNPMFPKRVNVEFVRFTSMEDCRVYFYERGVGPTQASSTGSAAVFAVLRRLGLVKDRLVIACGAALAVPEEGGGAETIQVSWNDGIFIRNFTRLVCRGSYFA
jgi:diaminopimelate epimerase